MFPARKVKNSRQSRRVRIWCFLFLFLTLPLGADETTLWSQSTEWGRVVVRQEGNVRKLIFTSDTGETEESRMRVDDPAQPMLEYVRQMARETRGALEQAASTALRNFRVAGSAGGPGARGGGTGGGGED